MVKCFECERTINTDEQEPEIGDILVCESCGAEHEVISVDPVKLELIEEEK